MKVTKRSPRNFYTESITIEFSGEELTMLAASVGGITIDDLKANIVSISMPKIDEVSDKLYQLYKNLLEILQR